MAGLTLGMLIKSCRACMDNTDDIIITYRTHTENGEDIFVGRCKYSNGNIISFNHDSYSLEVIINGYEMHRNTDKNIWDLTIWSETNKIRCDDK